MGRSYLEGPLGWARYVPTPPDHPNADTTVTSWFMHLPNQGLGWDKYVLYVISLQDVPGRPPAVKRYPQAEFELVVAALAPNFHPVPEDPQTWRFLDPVNFVDQFHGVSREQAGRVAEACAAACVAGRLLAETQMLFEPADGGPPKMMVIKHLHDMWKLAVAKGVEHERTGGLHGRVN
jgi:hypothetical protein